MIKILISSCLLGEKVRYDSQSKPLKHRLIDKWQAEGRVIGFCPEVAGGLSVPRASAEIQVIRDSSKVMTQTQGDVTRYFEQGALSALQLCQQQGIRFAILTDKSPSCGSTQIYDGSFSKTLVAGEGITTRLLRNHGIQVFSPEQLDALELKIKSLNE